MEHDEKAWSEVVATSEQTFLLFRPSEGLAGQDLLHFCFSPLQLRFLVELEQDFLLAFPFITCIYLVTTHEMPGSHCSPSAAVLRVFCPVLPDCHQLLPKGEPHQPTPTCLSAPCWSFPSGKPAKTPRLPFTGSSSMSVDNPGAIGTGTAKGLPSPGPSMGLG